MQLLDILTININSFDNVKTNFIFIKNKYKKSHVLMIYVRIVKMYNTR